MLVALVLPGLAQAADVTPLVGWQNGGTIEVNHLNTPLNDSVTFGVSVSIDRGRARKLDVLFIHQQTRADRHDPFSAPTSVDVSVDYIQVGGRYILHPDQRAKPYIAATIGGTRLSVNRAWAVNPSGALGAGVDVRINPTVAVRFDGRFHVTLSNTSAEIGCDSSGTCSGTGTGRSFTQFTAAAGLVFRF